MWPSGRSLAAAALLLAVAGPVARAAARLDVTGSVIAVAPRLEVRVDVRNDGDTAAVPLDLSGELFGQKKEARLEAGVPAKGSASVVLEFDASAARPGVHALVLLLEHPLEGTPDGAGNPPLASRRAWLLLALGENAPPPVRLSPSPLRLAVKGALEVRLESADAAPHAVRLRAWTARGLRTEGDGVRVELPASGSATAQLPLVRAGAPRGTRHGVLLVAESEGGALARVAVGQAEVEIAPDPALMPRLRPWLTGLGAALVALALVAELWLRRRNARGARVA